MCTKGDIEPAWKVEKPMYFWSFREKLSEQMLQYKPTRRKYPGDANMQAATQQSRQVWHENTDRTNQNVLDMRGEDPQDFKKTTRNSILGALPWAACCHPHHSGGWT
jgi:hypothetical protein